VSAADLIELSDVSYEVAGHRILDGIHWRIQAGEHWALLGRNGAGKTTLLQIACGYIWPNAGGEVLRQGRALTDLRQLRRSIGWVTSTLDAQIPRYERSLDTVVSGRYAGIGLKRLLGEHPQATDYHEALAHMQELGIAGLADQAYHVLSQGERQKVLLARACMAQPMLMILDEPCAGLDPASRESFLATLQRLADSGSGPAMVLVTHHVEEIMPAFSQTLILDQGRIVGLGPTRNLLDGPVIQHLYDGALSQLIWHHGRCWPIVG
jgi:iron complex transport system ATP-binding protein